MAHFAILDEFSEVTTVLVVNNEAILDEDGAEQEHLGKALLSDTLGVDETLIIQCSYNGSFRKKYPAIGDLWREDIEAFISPQPSDSFTLNEETGKWDCVVPRPSETGCWVWIESEKRWEER